MTRIEHLTELRYRYRWHCRYCGAEYTDTRARHEAHEATCPSRPRQPEEGEERE